MGNSHEVIRRIREDQLTNGIRFFSIIGFPALLASISRVFHVGWNNIFYVHIVLYCIILGLAVFQKKLTFQAKSIMIICTIFLIGITGLLAWGLVSLGLITLFAFCLITAMLFGTRVGILSVIISIVSVSIVGTGVVFGIIGYTFNPSDFLTSSTAWLTSIMALVISAGIIVLTVSTMNQKVYQIVRDLDEKNNELVETNSKLEKSLNESKKLKAGLERAQKMELVGTIAGGVAHDLNNVLSASLSYPELVLMDLSEASPMRKPMEAILKSSKRAAAIVQDLLTLTRRGVPIEEVVNINHDVKECLASPEFEKIMQYHPGVNMEVHLADDLYNIMGASFHLSKTIINLISNAAEAMLNGGKIILETKNIALDRAIQGFEEIKEGTYAVLSISDTGTGIPDEDRKKIFEPFYSKKVMGKSGTGLGMAVVWNTVKDHKGYIDIEGAEGEGVSFTLFFPATNKPFEKHKTDIVITEYKGKGESILVVDDVVEQRDIAINILSMLGYSVDTVPSGEAAIEYIKEHSPDLIILDMIMAPGMDGLDTYKEIIKLRPQQKTIIVSGFSETIQIREAQKLGAGAYIPKPYTIEKIGLAVRAELDRKN